MPLGLLCLVNVFVCSVRAADAPRLSAITIDGALDDWAERGFVIENLASLDATPVPPTDFSARARLGWDEEGFLFAIEIVDDIAKEVGEDLYKADSVEIFLARAVGAADRLQVLLAPGLIPPLPDGPRIAFGDHRKDTSAAPRVQVARAATANGYILEGRVPWRELGWSAEGALGVQLVVNDADADTGLLKWVWHPGGESFRDPQQLNEVRLAEAASPPDRTVWRWNPIDEDRIAVVVKSKENSSRTEWITARENERLVAHVALVPDPIEKRSEFILPTRSEDVVLSLDDRVLGVIPLRQFGRPDPERMNQVDYSLTSAVFSGEAFPPARLAKAAEIEKMLGAVTIHPRYFNAEQQEVTAPTKPGRYGVVYDIKPRQGAPVRRYQTLFKLPQEINWRIDRMEVGEIEMPAKSGFDPRAVRAHAKDLGYVLGDAWREHVIGSPDGARVLAAIFEAAPDAAPVTGRTNAWRRNQDWWYELRQKIGDWEQYDLVVHTPTGYDADPEKRWPLVLFLHGSGDGENRQILQKWGPPKQVAQGRDFPFILVAPRSPAGPWQGWYAPQLGKLLDEIEAKYRVDKDRIYVTGLSMGGSGTWRLAAEFPERFAAIAPFCGGANESDAPRIAQIPTWAFHGDQDTAVPVEYTLRMIDAIKKSGGEPRLTIYPGVGHECWEKSYAGQEFYDWLLSHHRSARSPKTGKDP